MKRPVVHAGERLDLFVGVAGKTYTFLISHNATNFPPATAMCAKHMKCRNTTAEVITEAPGGGPEAKHGLADMGTPAARAVARRAEPGCWCAGGWSRNTGMLFRLALTVKRAGREIVGEDAGAAAREEAQVPAADRWRAAAPAGALCAWRRSAVGYREQLNPLRERRCPGGVPQTLRNTRYPKTRRFRGLPGSCSSNFTVMPARLRRSTCCVNGSLVA